jgi:hypothetical protein
MRLIEREHIQLERPEAGRHLYKNRQGSGRPRWKKFQVRRQHQNSSGDSRYSDNEPTTITVRRRWEFRSEDLGERSRWLIRRQTQHRENVKWLYSLVWGQCTKNMQHKIEAFNHYAAYRNKSHHVPAPDLKVSVPGPSWSKVTDRERTTSQAR